VAVSQQHARAAYLVDGDLDSRWLSGAPQSGAEWIDVRFAAPTDVARIEMVGSVRTLYDYPRRLAIEGVDASGATHALFEGSIVSALMVGLAADELSPHAAIDLPPNRSTRVRLRPTVPSDRWWSVHELEVWERR
jgi:hypothetical protein